MISSLIVIAIAALAPTSAIVRDKCPCYHYNGVDVKEDDTSEYFDVVEPFGSTGNADPYHEYSVDHHPDIIVDERAKRTTHIDGKNQAKKFMYCNDTSVTNISGCQTSDITTLSIRTPSIPLFAETISGFTNMTELHVEHFEHPKLSKAFLSGQRNLILFQIYSTSLEYVDKHWFKYAPKIITLVLSRNKIHSLAPETFSYLPRLKSVYLDRNPLTTLPPALFSNKPLRNLYLHDNRWHCDSEMVAFMEKMKHNNVQVPIPSYCVYPEELQGLDLSYLRSKDICWT